MREIAYQRLREDILSCRLHPGQRISERRIAADTKLGISAVREALTRLDHEGLVHTQPRRGYQVKPMTLKGVDDLFNFWELLGPEAVRRGVNRGAPEQIDRAVTGHKRFRELESSGLSSSELTQRWLDLSEDTFAALADATDNPYITSAWRQVAAELRRVLSLLNDSVLIFSFSSEYMTGWSEALSRRDGERAAELTRDYIHQSHNRVLHVLARWPSVTATEIVPLPQSTTRPARHGAAQPGTMVTDGT
ncbi:GntR family transcriptional regulator [Streptomyces griseorubiginosus]|uniref:GntR family transcriptional regulator n=1 Tax=Streptomyces griseorubiginosus TaxID=67304 RepID=UPI001AD69469|nr:GntR family transcriptional regulator [Streptomyces griseorubiginosus]MBO4253328.1 GntR family transcriptional regulator [Streptomyces griseorubiginosus]